MHRKQNESQTRRHRLIGHDYSEPGFYFITFGTKNQQHLLGEIENDQMILSPTGQALDELLAAIPGEFEQLELDSLAIMPNHVHLLIYLKIDMEPPISISDIVRIIKGRSAALHRKLVQDSTGLWQKGFHDEIVRSDQQLVSIRRYIAENPLRWQKKDVWN